MLLAALMALAISAPGDDGTAGAAASASNGLDFVGQFKSLCWSHIADPSGALAQADAEGWGPAPAGLAEQLAHEDKNMLDAQVRMNQTPRGVLLLLTAKAVFETKPAAHGRACTIIAPGGAVDVNQARADLVAWLQHEPDVRTESNGVNFAFSDGPHGREFLSTAEPEQSPAWRAGTARIISLQSNPSVSLIGLMVPDR
jgi:hypothetical protein